MAYNAEGTLSRAIESVLGQTRGDFHYFVLNNASTDDTGRIIRKYAKSDERVMPFTIYKNDIRNGALFFSMLAYSTSAKYMVWCDADDEYTPDFLENMVNFSEENNLDIAACGYEKIDSQTNQVLKRKVLDENLVLYDNLFASEFMKYRGFTVFSWGKLHTVQNIKTTIDDLYRRAESMVIRTNRICDDSIHKLLSFRVADRVGIFGKAMYKYYQYPHSASNTDIEASLNSYKDLWEATKEYLEYFGEIDQLNWDYLYAIHLSLVEEAADKVFASSLTMERKLKALHQIFGDPVWAETMIRDADPQFRNLAGIKGYVSQVRNKILALPGASEQHPACKPVLSLLTAAALQKLPM
jgi:glycosyltransferase involved in cell wall biosynthesis